MTYKLLFLLFLPLFLLFAQNSSNDSSTIKLNFAGDVTLANHFESHIKETARTLEQDNAPGKRLDFMMQELNREANTIASKTSDKDISHKAIQLKVIIEQMREQIQNIE